MILPTEAQVHVPPSCSCTAPATPTRELEGRRRRASREDVPMPPLNPLHTIPVPPPTIVLHRRAGLGLPHRLEGMVASDTENR